MAMLIASASVEINMVSPFASFIGCFACSTPQMVIWLPRVLNNSQNLIWQGCSAGLWQRCRRLHASIFMNVEPIAVAQKTIKLPAHSSQRGA
jgi:hypothetical protein